MPVFPKQIDLMEQAMRAATLRHEVIANNIANVNVPGFQAAELSFEDRLREALQLQSSPDSVSGLTTHERHIPFGAQMGGPVLPEIRPAQGGAMRNDGNNVDIEAEMTKMAANQLWYQSLVRSIADEFSRLRMVISEGRR